MPAATATPSQTGAGTDWREQLDKLLPITLNEVRVVDGTLRFRNFTSEAAGKPARLGAQRQHL